MPAFLAPAIGAAANVIGGAIGNALSSEQRNAQERMLAQVMEQFKGISVPEAQMIVAEQLGPSAQEGVQGQMDPRLRGEQLSTLDSLDAYSKDGNTAESRAAMNRILGDLARSESSGRNAILGNMRARGVSGSGAELAMQLNGNQATADRAQTAGLDQAAQAQRRMLDAAVQKGSMAGSMRNQEYGQAADAARARDMIAQYNATSRDRARQFNAGQIQQRFSNEMQRANGIAGANNGAAQAAGQGADRTAGMWAGVGNGVGQAATGVATELAKEDHDAKDKAFMEKMWGGK